MAEYVTHYYSNGDICDLTGMARTVQVKLKCASKLLYFSLIKLLALFKFLLSLCPLPKIGLTVL